MAADLAIAMGVPIYGIVAHVATATDKEGRSVPAPGKGKGFHHSSFSFQVFNDLLLQ